MIEGRIAHQAETWGNEAIAIHEALWNGTEFAPKDLLRPAGRDTRFPAVQEQGATVPTIVACGC
jgi:hypothetical protein